MVTQSLPEIEPEQIFDRIQSFSLLPSLLCSDHVESCSYPSVPLYSDAQLSSEFIVNGTVVTYKCNDGYELFGSSSRTCSNGQWVGVLPYCGE